MAVQGRPDHLGVVLFSDTQCKHYAGSLAKNLLVREVLLRQDAAMVSSVGLDLGRAAAAKEGAEGAVSVVEDGARSARDRDVDRYGCADIDEQRYIGR